MATLSGINFSIVLDKSLSTPELRLSDTSTLAGGIANNLTGIFSITQPDGVTITGSFSSPDIYYSGGALVTAIKELRLASNGSLQNGLYSITYTVKHPSYDDTTVTKTFTLSYAAPTLTLSSSLNVFTPNLKAIDLSSYTLGNYTLQSVVRAWEMTSAAGNTTGGNVSQFDLGISNSYYDSIYSVKLTSTISYTITAENWVTVKDKVSTQYSYSTIKPKTLNELQQMLTAFWVGLQDDCGDILLSNKFKYAYAYTLFDNFKANGLCGYTGDLIDLYKELIFILNGSVSTNYTPTNTVLTQYNFADYCGYVAGGGGGGTLQITAQPTSATRTVSGSVSFSVTAVGTATLTYQWRKNGVNINGATSAIYNLSNLQISDAGNYDCIVTNGLGTSLTSMAATLTVNAAAVTFLAEWGWADNDPTSIINGGTWAANGSGNFNTGANVVADFRSAGTQKFLVMRTPNTESTKTVWFNTNFNNGTIPDQIFKDVLVTGGYKYYITRLQVTFDNTATTTFS